MAYYVENQITKERWTPEQKLGQEQSLIMFQNGEVKILIETEYECWVIDLDSSIIWKTVYCENV